MKLFGYKRWYEKDGGKFRRKIKVKKSSYQIFQDEIGLNEVIANDNFVTSLKEYKTRSSLLGNKFNEKNILFKLPENYSITNIEILQSKALGEINQKLRKDYSKKNYTLELNKLYNKKELSQKSSFKYKKLDIKLFSDIEEFNKIKDNKDNKKCYAIYYKVLSKEEVDIKKNIYEICEAINKTLFEYLVKLSEEKIDFRNIKESFLRVDFSFDDIKADFLKLKEENINYKNLTQDKNSDAIGLISFLFNLNKNKTSDKKKIFASKIINFLKDKREEITTEEIKDFLIDEGIHFGLLKREEKVKYNEKSWIKTYIENDKHNSYLNSSNKDKTFLEKVKDSEKIKTIQELLGKDITKIRDDIFELYKIDILIEDLKKEKINDTNLFGVYKAHYEKKVKKEIENYIKTENDEKDNCKKLIAKIVYRYIKGRIEKIITYKCENKLDDIFKEDILKEKINKKVVQYIIENLIYLGKVKLLNEDKKGALNEKNVAKEFEIFSIKEELELEFLNFVSATNLKLNELLKKDTDFFGGSIEVDKDNIEQGINILGNRLPFNYKQFESYRKKMVKIRSEIIHRGNSSEDNISLFEYYKTSDKLVELEKDYGNIIEKINELKISDEEICKNLNFDILFNYENMKDIIGKINGKTIGKTNTIYFPNYSRLVPRIESELRKEVSTNNINDMEFSILKNASIYLNKVLYYKTISNWEEDKEEEYKNAQIRASKGDRKAIKKFQNKFIDEYLNKIDKEYPNLFNFDYLKNIEAKISEANGERNLDKNCILKSISKDIEIKNDFEYIVIVSALIMNDNTYINKFRNRLFSTFTALESMNSDIENLKDIQNLIEILDTIIATNKGKRDYRNEQLLNSDSEIEKIRNKIENLKTEIQNITLTEEDYREIIKQFKTNEKKYDRIMNIHNKNNLSENNLCKYNFNLTLENYLNIIFSNSENIYNIFNNNKKTILEILNEDIGISVEEWKNRISDKDDEVKKELMTFCGTIKEIEKTHTFFKCFFDYLNLEDIHNIEELKNKYKNNNNNNLDEDIDNHIEEIKKFVGQIPNLEKIKRLEKSIIIEQEKLNNMNYSRKSIDRYITKMYSIIESSNGNFEQLYYQKVKEKEGESKKIIYKKNLFYYINQESFEWIYNNFLKKDLECVSTDELKNNTEIVEKINIVNRVLSEINKSIHSSSKEYKEYFKQNLDSFKYKGIESFEEFKKIYNEIKEYKKKKDIVEMSIVGKILNYLVEISWKLSIQVSRIERDIDYLYNGIIELDSSKKENDNKEAVSRLEKVLTFCRQNEENKDLFKSLEIVKEDLNKDRENSTRNIVVHFYLLKKSLTEINLKEIIDRVSKLSEYRSKYNNAVYNMCFEVFKKDFELDYKKLKTKFTLSSNDDDIKVFEIKDILSPKKVSILGIENDKTLLNKVKILFKEKIDNKENI